MMTTLLLGMLTAATAAMVAGFLGLAWLSDHLSADRPAPPRPGQHRPSMACGTEAQRRIHETMPISLREVTG